MAAIDWVYIFGNALWIIGLAAALAGVSYASWEASIKDQKFTQVLNQESYSLVFAASGLLFASGLAVTSFGNWRFFVWTVTAFGFLAYIIYALFFSSSQNE